jgi:hypothetical protein
MKRKLKIKMHPHQIWQILEVNDQYYFQLLLLNSSLIEK